MTSPEKQTALRLPIGRIFLWLLVILPFVEIAVLIKVGSALGVLPTIGLILLTGLIGTWMVRRQGFAVLLRAQRQMEQGVPPMAEVFEGFCLVLAGMLLLLPGFVTDVLGVILLLPPVRSWLFRRVGGGMMPPQPGRGRVLEGQYEEVAPADAERLPPRADDQDDDMPRPRGGWDRRR
jgi:UPF0716 protein FxsA